MKKLYKIWRTIRSWGFSNEVHLHFKVRPNGEELFLHTDNKKYDPKGVERIPGRFSLTERESFLAGKLK